MTAFLSEDLDQHPRPTGCFVDDQFQAGSEGLEGIGGSRGLKLRLERKWSEKYAKGKIDKKGNGRQGEWVVRPVAVRLW